MQTSEIELEYIGTSWRNPVLIKKLIICGYPMCDHLLSSAVASFLVRVEQLILLENDQLINLEAFCFLSGDYSKSGHLFFCKVATFFGSK